MLYSWVNQLISMAMFNSYLCMFTRGYVMGKLSQFPLRFSLKPIQWILETLGIWGLLYPQPKSERCAHGGHRGAGKDRLAPEFNGKLMGI